MEKRRVSQAKKVFPELRGSPNPGRPLRQLKELPYDLRISGTPHRRRVPVVSGIFYPDDREALAGQLAGWGLKQGTENTPLGGQVIIAPHAAWDISGIISAAAFAAVQANSVAPNAADFHGISRVILLGPCHSQGEQGIYLTESASFQTPLGDLLVDRRVNQKLSTCSTLIKESDAFHLGEHSLEVLLPMVKYCFPDVKIVPILAQGNRPVLISALARALRVTVEKYMDKSLLVVSSNASVSEDPAAAFSMADELRLLLSGMDTGALLARLSERRISACGGPIIAALLESGLLDGKRFSALTPLIHEIDEGGQTVYFGAFAAG